jgi:integrase/recombinase XerD
MLLPAAIDSFFDWLLPRKLAASSIDSYRQDLEMISRELLVVTGKSDAGELQVGDLTKANVRSAFANFAAERSKASILRAHSTWRQFFDFLVSDGEIDGNPMAAVNRPKLDERKPKPLDGWDEDTVSRLLESLAGGERGGKYPWPELDVAVVATLLATGARSSELLAMDIASIEGKSGSQLIRVIGKGAKPRTIPIEDGLDLLLGRYLETRKARFPTWKARNVDPLFVSPRTGVRLTARQLHWMLDQGLSAAGLANRRSKGAMAHAFRHTYGTTLAADGAPVAAIRKLMGHSSINTSQGYIDSLAREEREVAARNRVYSILEKLSDD